MTARVRSCLVAVLLLFCGPARGADLASVQRCLAANAPERSSRYQLAFEAREPGGRVSEQRAQVYWRRFAEAERRVLLRIVAPEKVAGSALLAIVKPETLPEIYFYLPELGKVQRVHRLEQLRGFLGRNGVELAELWRMIEATDLAQRFAGTGAEIAGRPTWSIEADFELPRQQGSEHVVSQIDQATCVPLRIESLRLPSETRRRLVVDPARVEVIGSRWLPREIAVEDLQSGATAIVRVLSLELDPELPPGLLTKKALVGER